jgi:hypothetical protein
MRKDNQMNRRNSSLILTWSIDELKRLSETDDLHISPFREDGKTYGTPTWIWSVVTNNALFVRAYNGRNSSWYKAAVNQEAGRITAAGMTREVIFEQTDSDDRLNDIIDEAYRKKYSNSPYLGSMISSRARFSTIKIIPKN